MKKPLKIFILLLLSLGSVTSVSAKNLKIEEILVDLDSIQVGAFKERKNILHQNQYFSHYNTFVEYGENFNRFYIVNIKKDDFLKVLAEVKKVNPSAFKATKKFKKLLKNTKMTQQKIQYKTPTKKRYHDSGFLNSETILKTRKKFF